MTLELSQAVALCLAHSKNATNVGRAVGIMFAESGLDPTAVCHNVRNSKGKAVCGTPSSVRTLTTGPLLSTDRGIWQINDHWHSEVSDAQAFDPVQATVAAYRISNGFSDFHQWATAPLLTSSARVERVVQLATDEAKAQLKSGGTASTLNTVLNLADPYGLAPGHKGGIVPDPVKKAVQGAVYGPLTVAEFLGKLGDPKTWVRVLEVVGGATCLLIGAFLLDRSLTSQLIGTAASNVVGGAASKVGSAAVVRNAAVLA